MSRFNEIPNRDVFSEHFQAQERLVVELKQRIHDLEEEVCGMRILLEIKAAEGGDDAKLLVKEIGDMYLAFAAKAGVKVLENDHG